MRTASALFTDIRGPQSRNGQIAVLSPFKSNIAFDIEQSVPFQWSRFIMLDAFGAVFILGYLASILTVAIRAAVDRGAVKQLTIALTIWLAAQGSLVGLARSGATGSLPPNILMFTLSLFMLVVAWVASPAFRRAAASAPLSALVGLHAWRLGGFFFLRLYADGRLGTPFAPVAAIGDMITGAIAAGLALALLRGRQVSGRAIGLWNAFGLADLLIAVTLALLSTSGAPFQLFTDVPPQPAFAGLPWMLVPAAIVPALMFVHSAVALRLRTERGPVVSNRGQAGGDLQGPDRIFPITDK